MYNNMHDTQGVTTFVQRRPNILKTFVYIIRFEVNRNDVGSRNARIDNAFDLLNNLRLRKF